MRLRTAGVGFVLALSAPPLLAQSPPAATLGQLRPVEDPTTTTARGQYSDPRLPAVRTPLRNQTPPGTVAPAPGSV